MQRTLVWFSMAMVMAAPALTSERAMALDLNKVFKGLKKDKKKKAAPAAVAENPVPSPSMCDASTSVGLCYAFSEPADAATQSNQADQFACKLMKGRFMAMSGCPRSNAFGRCSVLEGKAGSYLLYYYPADKVDLASAKADCENPKSGVHAQVAGSWLPF